MKLSRRETLASGILDAPVDILKNVEEFDSFAVQLLFTAGTVASTCYLMASLDYDTETASGAWSIVSGSTQTLDETDAGTHIWNVTEFHAPYIRIIVTGDVGAVEVTFIGQPNQARLSQ